MMYLTLRIIKLHETIIQKPSLLTKNHSFHQSQTSLQIPKRHNHSSFPFSLFYNHATYKKPLLGLKLTSSRAPAIARVYLRLIHKISLHRRVFSFFSFSPSALSQSVGLAIWLTCLRPRARTRAPTDAFENTVILQLRAEWNALLSRDVILKRGRNFFHAVM